MAAGKGVQAQSWKKHDDLRAFAFGRLMIALIFLKAGERVAVVDMHAADGKGVLSRQPDLYSGPSSEATAKVSVDIANALRRKGIHCDLVLCEKNRERRKELSAFAVNNRALLVSTHQEIPPLIGCAWALIFNDPNGPRDHGVDVLQRIAGEVKRADFLIVVNEGAVGRIIKVTGTSTSKTAPKWSTSVAEAAKVRAKYDWMASPIGWARMLNRLYVIASRRLYGRGAMQGRILLVTNYAQSCPTGYELFAVTSESKDRAA
jgi:hypothetical protein